MTTIENARNQIINMMEKRSEDIIGLPVGKTWPEGLAKAVVDYYGKYATSTIDETGKITQITINLKVFRFYEMIRNINVVEL